MNKKVTTNRFRHIFIYEQSSEFSEKAKSIIEQVENGAFSAVASTMSLTEILVKAIREGNISLVEKQYRLLFSHFPNLSIIPIDNAIAERAAFLRGTYGIKTPDALILACAINAQAELFITNDLRLEHIKEIKCVPLNQL